MTRDRNEWLATTAFIYPRANTRLANTIRLQLYSIWLHADHNTNTLHMAERVIANSNRIQSFIYLAKHKSSLVA